MEENFGISRTSTEIPTPHTEDLQTLLNIVQRLTNELAAARSEAEQLRATTTQFQNQSSKNHVSSSQPEPLLATASQSSLDFPGHNTVSTPCRNPE
ncbi:hypothetical protein G6F16_011953 [Rhizopus arrhizus]|uniref:Uncharacterized protein n=1 Tax=Rhizopus oryzae TaxID=64495 RepID=A0A9P7BMF4_RHIOR|nr:hypothetical protein G6F24_011061 [Rhizopus arrhizus]KAG0773050.1 hypothetical protein G6F22_015213 [Rhizopus arrhizus]KAG0781312.1 hypothetical protein G6F21_011707 [Rhizopus arrhizus]KAG0810627.1 hypothetical protein G6F20_007802 [Rhizopus arrhizus]KAG0822526.1 hypothetical protein G6F19_011322 [Rhizopus arrhizus]